MTTAKQLTDAYAAHQAARAATPFRFETALTDGPIETPEVMAGEAITTFGLTGAMAMYLERAAREELSQFDREVAGLLAAAAVA
jgi:hypothetical protein